MGTRAMEPRETGLDEPGDLDGRLEAGEVDDVGAEGIGDGVVKASSVTSPKSIRVWTTSLPEVPISCRASSAWPWSMTAWSMRRSMYVVLRSWEMGKNSKFEIRNSKG